MYPVLRIVELRLNVVLILPSISEINPIIIKHDSQNTATMLVICQPENPKVPIEKQPKAKEHGK